MEQVPRFEDEVVAEERRKKRFLDRWLKRSESTRPIVEDEAEAVIEEVNPETKVEVLPNIPEAVERVRIFGRRVMDFGSDVVTEAAKLPIEKLDTIQPVIEELSEAVDSLDTSLNELDASLVRPVETAAPAEVEAEAKEPSAAEETTGMVALAMMALVGGGLLVAAAEKPKPVDAKKPAKAEGGLLSSLAEQFHQRKEKLQKRKAADKIAVQKAELAAQAAELSRLKAAEKDFTSKPQPEKYIKKVSQLTERQVDITNSTIDQIRGERLATETERLFHIPERPQSELGEQAGIEKEVERLYEHREVKQADQPAELTVPSSVNQPPGPLFNRPTGPTDSALPSGYKSRQVVRAWVYGLLLAVTLLVTIWLLVAGS